jgi:hypothetical protein
MLEWFVCCFSQMANLYPYALDSTKKRLLEEVVQGERCKEEMESVEFLSLVSGVSSRLRV